MSSSKFERDDGKARVARHTTAEQQNMLASLEYKRQQLAKMSHAINSGKVAPAKNKVVLAPKIRGPAPKRKKNTASDEELEDDEFIASDEEEEESEFDASDDEEAAPRKRKQVANKGAAKKKGRKLESFVKESKVSKVHRLSESSSDGDDKAEEGWLCKPRLNSHSGRPPSSVSRSSDSPIKVTKRRTLVISESSDSDVNEDPQITNAATLKTVVKQAAKHKRKNGNQSDSEWEVDEEDGEDNGGDFHEKNEETPSDDSEGEERRVSRGLASENELQRECLRFFNTAARNDLMATPRVNDKITTLLLEHRPFDTFSQLELTLSGIRGGQSVLDAYIESLEKRGVLEKILDDCKDHSEQVAEDYIKYKDANFVPKILNPKMSLHDYQQQGLNWLVMMHDKNLNCILGDEMGLGKTIQVISFLAWCKEQNVRGPHLIIVPSSTVENWMNEMAKWCPDIKLMTYYGNQDERKQLRHMVKKKNTQIDVLLTTYNMVGSKNDDRKFFKKFKINYVIYDEGHKLKNCATEGYRSLMKIKGSRKILLTGTPLQNNLIELISLMYFVMTRIFTKYCDDIAQLLSHFKQQGGRALDSTARALYQQDRIEQAKAILEPYILRRLKAHVLNKLPPKTDETVLIEMEPFQAGMYDDQLELLRTWDGDKTNAVGGLMRLRQAANHPLMMRQEFDDALCRKIAGKLVRWEKEYERKNPDYVAEDLYTMSDFQIHQLCEKFTSTEEFRLDDKLSLKSGKCKYLDKKLPELKLKGDKVLIFSQFTQILDILEVYLRVRKHSYCRLDGSTPVMERQEMINAYNNDPDRFVFLLSTRAGGLGINLTSANHIIIHDIDFNPYNDKQAEDRCHRMGQQKPVHVIRLISKKTVEEGISRLAKRKLHLEQQVTVGTRGGADEGPNGEEGESERELEEDELVDLMGQVTKAKPTSPRKK